jgi:hypothetical protein
METIMSDATNERNLSHETSNQGDTMIILPSMGLTEA